MLGKPETDVIVDLFNRTMKQLKDLRLHVRDRTSFRSAHKGFTYGRGDMRLRRTHHLLQ